MNDLALFLLIAVGIGVFTGITMAGITNLIERLSRKE